MKKKYIFLPFGTQKAAYCIIILYLAFSVNATEI